jgi:chlorophyllide a reductase subunit Y
VLAQYADYYPEAGPHDQPQSMCPAFGSLRVGLRMRRTATILSGSACCVYGLTFTSHFYGARRSVGYVPFNSESLVTGKLFEDIRDAVHKQADPALYDAIVIINLCVPTASGVPLQLLPKQINGVRIIGIDVPGFGVPTHAEAKDVLAGAMLKYARPKAKPARCRRRSLGRRGADKPTVTLLGEMFPADPVDHRHDARADGPGRRPGRAHARMARAVCRARLCAWSRHPPVLHRQRARVRGRRPHGGGLGAGRPRRHRSLAAGHR